MTARDPIIFCSRLILAPSMGSTSKFPSCPQALLSSEALLASQWAWLFREKVAVFFADAIPAQSGTFFLTFVKDHPV